MTELLTLIDGRPMADSRHIAEHFERQHKDVLKAVENMDCSEEFRERNFAHTPYVHPQNGQTYKMYQMTRDGFTFLVMGFTGKKAAEWKEKYIAAFNQMESAIKMREPMAALADPAILRQTLLTYTEKVIELEAKIEEDAPKIEALERISEAEGSLCITDAAKALQMRPKDLFSYMTQHGWIYKRPGGGHYLGYQSKVTQGVLEHKVTTVLRPDGSEKITEQVRITPKGISRLAQLIPPAAAA